MDGFEEEEQQIAKNGVLFLHISQFFCLLHLLLSCGAKYYRCLKICWDMVFIHGINLLLHDIVVNKRGRFSCDNSSRLLHKIGKIHVLIANKLT